MKWVRAEDAIIVIVIARDRLGRSLIPTSACTRVAHPWGNDSTAERIPTAWCTGGTRS